MNFISTRGGEETVSSSQAIIKGIANDGGLYVPNEFPNIYDNLKKKMGLSAPSCRNHPCPFCGGRLSCCSGTGGQRYSLHLHHSPLLPASGYRRD